MNDISPIHAAELAGDVYRLQTENQIPLFLLHPVFKGKNKDKKASHNHLKAEVGGRILLNHKDGFGICAEGGDNNKNELFLIFRGTTTANNKADMFTDARIGIKSSSAGLPVHCGFDHCFSSMVPDIRQFFSGNNMGNKVVHCIGHSLGGAVASLAADWVARNTTNTAKLYTFGAPRVGTEWFVKSTTSKIREQNMHRVYHRTDPVPMIPLFPFMHAPYNNVGHYLFSSQPLASGMAHKMENYRKSVEKKSWPILNETPESPYTIESAIESWLKSKSPVDATSATFWRWVDSALIYVLKKVAMGAIISVQSAFIGAFTLADKIAYLLAKGIDLAESISIWVEHLMRKLMQALGMKVAATKEELTRSLIRTVLLRLLEKMNNEARHALRKL